MTITDFRHPWRIHTPDGQVLDEVRSSIKGGALLGVTLRRFSFVTPAGEIGIDHTTGLFSILGCEMRHSLMVAGGDYRHWHRYGCYADFSMGKTIAGGVSDYSLGMQRRMGEATEIVLVTFPHEVRHVGDVRALAYLKAPGGRDSHVRGQLVGRVA